MKSPPFLYVLSQAVEEPGRIKASLFALFFALVLLTIAAIFSSLIIRDFPPQSAWAAFSYSIAGLLTLGLGAAGLLATLVTLTLAFGTKTALTPGSSAGGTGHATSSIITRLWGFELVRVEHGPLRLATPVPAGVPVTAGVSVTPWSWSAVQNRKSEFAVGAVGILEAALWDLHARGWIEVGLQIETITYLRRRQVSNSDVVHVRLATGYRESSNERKTAVGYWEMKLFEALGEYGADAGLELFDLILVTYGHSSAQPFDRVIELAEKDSGTVRAGTDTPVVTDTPEAHLESWLKIRAHISRATAHEPGFEKLVQERIRLALKNRVDT